MEILTHSAAETQAVGRDLAATLVPGMVVCLYGDLGSGKTTFVQGLAEGLGCLTHPHSPTFVLVHTYSLSKESFQRLYHIDLYRIMSPKDLQSVGLDELLSDFNAAVVIEWANQLNHLPKKRIDVHFAYAKDDAHTIQITRHE